MPFQPRRRSNELAAGSPAVQSGLAILVSARRPGPRVRRPSRRTRRRLLGQHHGARQTTVTPRGDLPRFTLHNLSPRRGRVRLVPAPFVAEPGEAPRTRKGRAAAVRRTGHAAYAFRLGTLAHRPRRVSRG